MKVAVAVFRKQLSRVKDSGGAYAARYRIEHRVALFSFFEKNPYDKKVSESAFVHHMGNKIVLLPIDFLFAFTVKVELH